jgi:hypothetical protein
LLNAFIYKKFDDVIEQIKNKKEQKKVTQQKSKKALIEKVLASI